MIRAVIFTIIVILSITQLGFIGLGLGGGAGGGGGPRGEAEVTGEVRRTSAKVVLGFRSRWPILNIGIPDLD